MQGSIKIESESANCDLEKVIYRMKYEVYDDKPCFWKKKTNSPFRFNNYKYRLLGKINRMSHESVFILTVVHIATNLLMVGKSLYLRNVKPTNNLKKDEIFGNTNWKHFIHLVLIIKKIFILITYRVFYSLVSLPAGLPVSISFFLYKCLPVSMTPTLFFCLASTYCCHYIH